MIKILGKRYIVNKTLGEGRGAGLCEGRYIYEGSCNQIIYTKYSGDHPPSFSFPCEPFTLPSIDAQ